MRERERVRMREKSCGIPEERWIDWLSGRLMPAEAESLARHLRGCPACAEVCETWAALLAPGAERAPDGHAVAAADGLRGAAPADRGGRAGAGGGVTAPAESAVRGGPTAAKTGAAASAGLPEWRRERLRAKVRWLGAMRRVSRRTLGLLRRPYGAATAAVSLVLAASAGLLLPGGVQQEAAQAPMRYAELNQPEAAAVLSRPDTVQYSMEAATGALPGAASAPARETVWLNARTHEMFLLLEGMLPSDDRDVQAWATSKGGDANLGLLEFHQGKAHLYSSGVRPEQWESIALTIEPKGGSLRPTSPQTASVRLGAEE